MRKFTRCFAFAIAAGLLVAAGAACSSSTKNADSSSNASQQSVDQLSARVQQDEMLNAWVTIQNMPLHTLDETLQGGTVDPTYVPTVRMLIRELALTNWTSDVQPVVKKWHDDAVALLQALESGKDIDSLKPLSSAVHEDGDTGKATLGNAAAKSLPADAGGPEPTPTPGG